jgi:cardiolipin synthase
MIIVRDLIIVSGGLGYHLLIGPFEPAPSGISKLNTLAQLVLVVAVMFDRGVLPLYGWMLTGLVYLVLLTTVASGLHYVVIWGRRALQDERARRPG